MRIAVMTVGSRGDVEPYLALAHALQDAGHEVTLATHEAFRQFVSSTGVRFSPLPGDPREVVRSPEAQEMQAAGDGLGFARRFVSVLRPWFAQLVEAVTPLHASAEAVVYSPLAFPSWHLAQLDGTPTALASLQPFAPTGAFPAVTFGGREFGRWGNRASHHLVRQLFWQPLRRMVNRWRVEELGLPALPLLGPWSRLGQETELYGYSTSLVPRPADWPPRIHVTGFWFLPEQPFEPPADLEDFLASGPPPVFAGFGSSAPRDAERLGGIVIGAAREARTRLLLGSGWAGLTATGDDVLTVGEVPYRWLFPRTRAVVHHGGAGTTAAGLAAGRPTVVVPFYADQPFWGARVEAVGAGPAPIPAGRLDAGRLAAALRACERPQVRARAEQVGHLLRAENGVVRAIEALPFLAP